jgi:WD40 repeat protein
VRVWRTADGLPVGEPLTGHDFQVDAVAAGALPDGTPVIIISGGVDGTVRMWRTADGAPTRASAEPTRIGRGCCRSSQRHHHCGWGGHRRPPASAPTAHALAVVLLPGTRPADETTG